MRRRALLACVAAFAGAVQAQPAGEALPMPPGGRPWRIGWLYTSRETPLSRRVVAAFHEAMHAHGWELDRHYTVDVRRSDGDARRYPALAAELVAAQPDLLLAIETTARLLREHTTTIPIVLWASFDPVAAGLVQSFARPGTNVTGVSNVGDGLHAKMAEALLEIVPQARRVAMLYDPNWAAAERMIAVVREVARTRRAEVLALAVTADPRSVPDAFAAVDRERVEALLIAPYGAPMLAAGAIAGEARRRRLPATGLLAAGGMATFAPDYLAGVRDAADFVDRILRGAKPAELPVRQLMTLKVTVDARRAREIGVELPKSLLLRADEVIE